MSGLATRIAEWRWGGDGVSDPWTDIDYADPSARVLRCAREIRTEPSTVELPDGRTLAYADLGDPDGEVVVLHHGYPNSRVLGARFAAPARGLGVRLVVPDRPGIGRSDPLHGRSFRDWPADLVALADSLGVESVPIVGVSAGCPYALSCAAQVPDRVSAVSVLAGIGPVTSLGVGARLPYRIGRWVPPLSEYVLARRAALGRTDPDRFLASKAAAVSGADEPSWKGETGYVVLESTVEGARDGVDGYLTEGKLLAAAWPFDLADVAGPVSLYYGDDDTLAPAPMRQAIAAGIPEADLTVESGLAHLSVMEEHGRTALERVIEE